MNKKFTKLIAALALLVFMTPSLAGWGQTRAEVVTYTLEPAPGSNNSYANNCDITINDITWNLTGNSTLTPWRIGGKSLDGEDRTLYSKTALEDNVSKIEVTHGTASDITVNSWTVIVATDASFSNVISTLTPTFEASTTTTITRPNGADWTNCYYKFVYNVTVSSTSNKYLQFTRAKFYKEEGAPSDFAITGDPVALNFDLYNNTSAQTVSYTSSSTGAVTVSQSEYVSTSVNGNTITVTPVKVTPSAQTITVSQAADGNYAAGSGTFTVNITDSTPQYTVTYKANGGTGDDIVDIYSEGDNVTVRANTFIYTSHAFTKWTTNQNGTGNEYQPDDEIQNIQANIELYAQWEVSYETVDELTYEFTGISGTGYSAWSDKTGASGAIYAGRSGGNYSSIQLNSTSPNGIVSTTSGGRVTRVVVTWNSNTANSRSVDIYGSNTAYEGSLDLYDADKQGTKLGSIVKGTSTELTVSGDYTYIGIRNSGNAIYMEKVEITWSTAPSTNPSITAEDVNIAYDAEEGEIEYTITNPVAGGSIVASTDAQWIEVDDAPQTDAQGSIDFICDENSNFYAHSATVTLTYTYSDSKTTVTKDITVTQALNPEGVGSSAANAFTVSEAIDAIDEVVTVSGAYARGTVSNIGTAYNSSNNYITFDMKDEAGDDYYLRAYHCVSTSDADASEVAVGDIVVVHGDLMLYNNSIYEFGEGCQLVFLKHPASITIEHATVDAAAVETMGTITVTYDAVDTETNTPDIIWYTSAEATISTEEPAWIDADINQTTLNVDYLIAANNGEARTAYFKIYGMDAEADDVYSNLVTINQAAYIPTTTYTLTTTIESGRHYIITNNSNKAMGAQNTNNRSAVDISIDNGVATVTSNDVYEFVINGPDANGSYTIYDVAGSGYLYAAGTGSANQLKKETFNNDGENRGFWEISFSDNAAVITAKTTATDRKIIRYNSSNACFSCYSTGQNPIYLYMKDETTPQYDFYKDIAAHTDATGAGNTDGWYFIASPLASAYTPAGSMIANNTYDLYRLSGNTWENFKNTDHADFTTLQNGQGYLYANSANTTLHFSGAINTFTTDNNANVKNLSTGWNLIGNPYNIPIYINKPYYTLNETRTAILATGVKNVAIVPCTGVIVEGGEIIFTPTSQNITSINNGNIQMTLAQQATNRGNAVIMDNAIVNFNEGSQLGKFYFGTQNANLYIPQGTEEYAIVSSNGQGTMPVNFRANENGTYTLTVNPENVEMNYLHLIDNMTGADIDLLQTPSYSFNATTTDYESRFKLVFASNGTSTSSATDETFAFYSNGNWVINNAGEATLQVVDLMGRILSSEAVNGSVSKTINATPGVYMLRLINGENVKVQKVVVE